MRIKGGPILAHTKAMRESRTNLERWATQRLDRATGEELAASLLHRRQETKFLMPASLLAPLITQLAPCYRAVRSGASFAASYRTLYFDTPALTCFHDHRERLPHHKVRIRHYDDRRLTIVEVKTKSEDQRSFKFRRPKQFGDSELNEEDREFVASHLSFSAETLIPQLWTNFCRVTLVGEPGERVTIDCDLSFRRGEVDLQFPDVAVIEVKQERYAQHTPIMRTLASMGLSPVHVSKYGAAVALTDARHARPRIASGTSTPWATS